MTPGSPSNVNRYLESFSVVAFLHKDSYPLLTIRKITKLSERLINEYLDLLKRAESGGYTDRINQLLDPFKVNEPLKKRCGRGHDDRQRHAQAGICEECLRTASRENTAKCARKEAH
ncbi:DUF1670 domain-containing protein [Methanophagales archaeon]|nr:MAG: DUF1670 domain-containing protein [Methanophagales archaeon]